MGDESHLHHHSYDVSVIATCDLRQLHEFVTRTKARIEITRAGSDERCLLISAEELASFERALEILSNTDDVRDIRLKIAQLAACTGPAVVVNA